MAITYCIVCNITGEKYYGSTINSLEKRLREHKCKSNSCCSKQIILRGDYDIYPLHEYETELEAKMKEKWYVDNKECINKQRVYLTEEERKQYRKERYENIKYSKEYRENKKKNKKQYRENNKEKIKEYQKEYRENNKEKLKKKRKECREINKEKFNEKAECEFCKFIGYKRHLKNHQKSKKCLEYQ